MIDSYLLSFLGSIAIFTGIPYGEELWRCLKAGRRRELDISTGRATS